MLDRSTDPQNGRLSLTCELPNNAARLIWQGTIPLISIDGGAQVALVWGTSTPFDLPAGTHRLRIEVRPGELPLEYRPIEHTVEILQQQERRLIYQAPRIPGFPPKLTDPDSKRRR